MGGTRRPASITMTTRSAMVLDLCNPDPDAIMAWDIAYQLATMARWNGALWVFLDVGTHCRALAAIAPTRYKMRALLHDAAEAYCGDIISPIKHALPCMRQFEELERGVRSVIYKKFGVRGNRDGDPAELKRLDLAMAIYEADLMGGHGFIDAVLSQLTPEEQQCTLTHEQRRIAAPILRGRGRLTEAQAADKWMQMFTEYQRRPETQW